MLRLLQQDIVSTISGTCPLRNSIANVVLLSGGFDLVLLERRSELGAGDGGP
jgi:hypothetical protein